ncbi:MAG TPA: FtsX-like permease family protein [Rhizomicrobium sp.]|jgi:putative ABC transport system permease protein|nr:FtsX-like permease family protein [Rhizomicrobium sp.]
MPGISCVLVAGANLLQHRLRLIAALAGIAVALFLLLLQISVLDAAKAKVTMLYNDFNFDLAAVPDTYQFMLNFETIDRVVLDQARATGDVAQSFGLNVDVVHWMQWPSKKIAYLFLIGLDNPGTFIREPVIRQGMKSLVSSHSLLMDGWSEPDIGPLTTGATGKIGEQRETIAGNFKLGLFFYGEGSAIVRNTDFPRLADRDSSKVSIGLFQLRPGVDPQKAKRDLEAVVPEHTLIFTRQELLQQERDYFLTVRPVGIMIYISMLIACLVGTVIMVQVLSTEVANRTKEYAVLKAIGATPWFVHGIGGAQALLLGLGGLLPALVLGGAVLWYIEFRTHLETALGMVLLEKMFAITCVAALCAASTVLIRVQRADPAALY